jgi:hypothetical protein
MYVCIYMRLYQVCGEVYVRYMYKYLYVGYKLIYSSFASFISFISLFLFVYTTSLPSLGVRLGDCKLGKFSNKETSVQGINLNYFIMLYIDIFYRLKSASVYLTFCLTSH